MTDLRWWVELAPDGWDFGPEADHIEPWEVRVTRPIVTPGPDGPRFTGRTIITHHIDGELVSTRTIEATDG
jgi:hypothetical protein